MIFRPAYALLLVLCLLIGTMMPLPARAQSLSATDTHNRAVTVPSDKPTLLAFLRPGQSQSEDAVKLLLPLLKERKALQIVAVVSGDNAVEHAGQLEKDGWPYPILADADYVHSGKFSVRSWPTVTVIGAKGEQVAHVAGLPVTFANDVSAYLDFAAGKIDKVALDKQLANREVVADSEEQKAARHAEVAQRLAEKGLKDQAQAEVAKALELKPTSAGLLMSLARTDLMIADTKGAQVLLEKLPAGEVSPGELNALKGWIAVESERWSEARPLLEAAVKLNPNPAEAFYLLGRVYEHDGDAAKSAEAYRKAFEHTAEGKPMTGK